MTTISGAGNQCQRCATPTEYVPLAFGYVCPACGWFDVDVDVVSDEDQQGYTDRWAVKIQRQSSAARSVTAKKVASAVTRSSEITDVERALKADHVQTLIKVTLGQLGHLNRASDVHDSLLQWYTLSLKPSRSIDAAKVVAACFAAVKRAKPALTIEEVCQISNTSEHATKRALQSIEDVLYGQDLLSVSKETPAVFVRQQIDFLASLLKTAPTLPPYFTVNKDQVRLLSEAQIDTNDFLNKCLRLTELCVRNGLYNRSAARGQTMDMALCAFAILMHCIEAQAGKPCNETWFAELAAFAPGWKAGQKMSGLSKYDLQLDIGEEDRRDSTYFDEQDREAVLRSTLNTVRETVKRRYVEVSRMLTIYIRALPWFDDHGVDGQHHKKAGRSKLGRDVKSNILSIRPLARSKIVRYTNDVLIVCDSLHAKADLMLESYRLASTPWSRFWATELHFNNVRQTASGRAGIRHVLRSNGQSTLMHDNIVSSLACLRTHGGQDEKRALVSAPLFSLESLEQMTDEVADRLLFAQGELDSYLRSPVEIEQRQSLLGLDDNVGSRKRKYSSVTGTASSNAEERLRALASGKRTKALEDVDVERIISQL